MTHTLAQAAAFTLAALVTVATFAGASGMAAQTYAKADAVAMASTQVVAMQTVVVTARRA